MHLNKMQPRAIRRDLPCQSTRTPCEFRQSPGRSGIELPHALVEALRRFPEFPGIPTTPDAWKLVSVPVSLRKGFPDFREPCKCLPESSRVVRSHSAADETSSPVASPKYDSDLRRLPEWNDITPSLKFLFPETEGDKFHTIGSKVDHDNEVISRDTL